MDAERIVHDVAERVREIVAEAEQRATEIVREAEADAKRIREQAEAEGRQRLDHVRKALDELQGKIGTGGTAPGGSADTSAEVEPGPVVVPEPEPPDVPEPEPEPVPEPSPEPSPQPEPPSVPEPEPPPDEGTPPQAGGNGAAEPGGKSADVSAARLVAMNMALDGASREAIEAHLAVHYELDDTAAIVDDVLALASE